jgi:hypothetical protein
MMDIHVIMKFSAVREPEVLTPLVSKPYIRPHPRPVHSSSQTVSLRVTLKLSSHPHAGFPLVYFRFTYSENPN